MHHNEIDGCGNSPRWLDEVAAATLKLFQFWFQESDVSK